MHTLLRKTMLFVVFYVSSQLAYSQGYTTIDVVKIDQKYYKEAMYFYNENWTAFRKEALKQRFISGYKMVKTPADSTQHYQLILITEYADSLTYNRKEENFSPIMKKISPNGPKMLNDIPRSRFLEYLAGYDAYDIVEDREKK
jgi:hypothetical protein